MRNVGKIFAWVLGHFQQRLSRFFGLEAQKISDLARRCFHFSGNALRDESGAFLPFVGLIAVVLIATAGAAVDFTRLQQARTRAQTALDAATLAMVTQLGTLSDAGISANAEKLVRDQLRDGGIAVGVTSVSADRVENSLKTVAYVDVPTIFAQLVNIHSIRASVTSAATAAAGWTKLEVALSLDISDSMRGSKMDALEMATAGLLDTLLPDGGNTKDIRVALVPWGPSVQIGPYDRVLETVRDTIRSSTDIRYLGATQTSDCVSRSSNAVVRSSDHELEVGNKIYFTSVTGMTELDEKYSSVTKVISSSRVEIDIDTRNFSSFDCSSGGDSAKYRKCIDDGCNLVVSSQDHGLKEHEYVYFKSADNMEGLVGNTYMVDNVSSGRFMLRNTHGKDFEPLGSNGAKFICASYGCPTNYFETALSTAASRAYNTHNLATCIGDREGPDAFTDAPPSATKFRLHYTWYAVSWCKGRMRTVPLTSNKSALTAVGAEFNTAYGTGGHIGIAWGWYVLSPNFNYLWSSESAAAPYSDKETRKKLIIMTDGAFNFSYCKGIVARDAVAGRAPTKERINCDSTNGRSPDQARAICDNIRKTAKNMEVYTIGFQLPNDGESRDTLEYCATTPQHFFLAETESALIQTFNAIAQGISATRLTE